MSVLEYFISGHRTFVAFSLFLLSCGMLFVSVVIYNRTKKIKPAFPYFVQFLLAIIPLCILEQEYAYFLSGENGNSFFNVFLYIPAVFLLLYILFLYSISLVTVIKAYYSYKNILTDASIKEGADRLPAGFLYSNKNGMPILCNTVIQELCYKIFGCDLNNSNIFWERLKNGEFVEGTALISDEQGIVIKLDNGRIWSFNRLENRYIDNTPLLEITAKDITSVYELNESLKEDNAKLKIMSDRLRRYSKDALELTAHRELLERKIHTHDELGRLLLETRRYLSEEKSTTNALELASRWHINAGLMTEENIIADKENLYSYLKKTADSVGVRLIFDGLQFPEKGASAQLIFETACEAMTNLLRHAGGNELYITLSESDNNMKAVFKNNGKQPEKTIKEGGGLSAIRLKAENMGGEMVLTSCPEYALTLILPKEKI